MAGVEYQVTKVDPTDPETKGMVYQVHKVTEEVAATLGGKVYRARIVKDPTEPTIAGKVYQIVLIGDPDDPAVKGKVYNAILTGGSEAVVVGPAVSPLALDDAIADTMEYVKAYGGTKQGLPDGYTLYDSLIGDGSAYIDLDCVLDQNDEIEIDFMKTSNIASRNVFGGRAGATANNISVIIAGSGNVVADFNNSDYAPYRVNTSMSQNTMYKIIVNKTGRYVYDASGTLVDSNTTACEDAISTPGCYVFNLAGAGLGSKFVGVVYKCVVKGKRDCVPAYNGTEYGMYDKISGRFFGNANTEGTFSAGNVVVPTPATPIDIISNNGVLKARHQSGLPLGYTLLEYIQSSGTQYIDTGIVDITDSEFVLDARLTATSASGFPTMLGALSSVNENKYKVIFGETASTQFYTQPGVGNNSYTYAFAADTDRHIFKLTTGAISGGTLFIDNNSFNFNYEIQTDTTLSLYLSARNKDNNASNFITMACYGLRIKKSGVLVRDFMPAKNSSGVVGMYDLVSGTFFTNDGTGDFVAGTPVSDPVEIYTDGTVETIAIKNNIFTLVGATYNETIGGTGTPGLSPNNGYSDYLAVTGGDVYNFSDRGLSGVALYDQNKVFQSRPSVSVGDYTIPAGIAYIRVNFRQSYMNNISITHTNYTATAEMLLKVGDYQDEQEILSGAITRNVGVVVLDGTEEDLAFNTQYNVAYFYIQDKKIGGTDFTPLLCSHLKLNNVGFQTMNYGEIASTIRDTGINMKVSSNITSLALFKQWLADQYAAGTPVIIVYPLATPTTESVAGQTLQVQDGDNTLEITQASIDGLELEAEYEKEA